MLSQKIFFSLFLNLFSLNIWKNSTDDTWLHIHGQQNDPFMPVKGALGKTKVKSIKQFFKRSKEKISHNLKRQNSEIEWKLKNLKTLESKNLVWTELSFSNETNLTETVGLFNYTPTEPLTTGYHLTPWSYGGAICCFESVKERFVPLYLCPSYVRCQIRAVQWEMGVGREEEVGGVTWWQVRRKRKMSGGDGWW